MTGPKEKKPFSHYHGDIVRVVFLIAAFIILFTLPTFQSLLNIPILTSIIVILILGVAAGLTNPLKKWSATINVVISVVGFLIFEYSAVLLYQGQIDSTKNVAFFLTNLILGLLFLISLYFSVKTLRGELITK